ncbi:MAG TPA: hypothetical protein VKX17_07205 [Planctomycetota bacterium]|nr:hypothetical protein [Planctomycetota bacterium]
MPSSYSNNSGACECGQVVFDLAGRKSGDILSCSWCGRKFRFLGADRIAPLTPEEAKLAEAAAKNTRTARGQKPPGTAVSVWPMIGFIVAFNALAFIALAVLLPKGEDSLRHTLWDSDFTVQGRAVWPDLVALAVGHMLGFCGWAAYIYRVHKKAKT